MVQVCFTSCRTILQIVLWAIYKITLQSVKLNFWVSEPCPKLALKLSRFVAQSNIVWLDAEEAYKQGDGKMKKGLLILITALMITLLFASFSTVAAEPNAPILCLVDMVYMVEDEGAYWEGTVRGCSLAGDIRFDPDPDNPSYPVGKTLHFFELFTIEPYSGGVIQGNTVGVGHLYKPFKFRANGWVTDATEQWSHLIGNKYFEMGTSTDPLDPSIPLTAEDMVMKIMPAQRPMP